MKRQDFLGEILSFFLFLRSFFSWTDFIMFLRFFYKAYILLEQIIRKKTRMVICIEKYVYLYSLFISTCNFINISLE